MEENTISIDRRTHEDSFTALKTEYEYLFCIQSYDHKIEKLWPVMYIYVNFKELCQLNIDIIYIKRDRTCWLCR